MLRSAIISAIALLAVATACASGSGHGSGSEHGTSSSPAVASRLTGIELADRPPAPDFELRDVEGRRVRLSDHRGEIVFVTFLYTRCPDVCPIIAESLNRALEALEPDGRSVRVLAVSVDPVGDTPARVRSYAAIHRLRPEFRYLLGSADELQPVWRAYDVLAFAADPESEIVGHTAQTVLVDADGLRRAVYAADASSADFVHDVRLLFER